MGLVCAGPENVNIRRSIGNFEALKICRANFAIERRMERLFEAKAV